MNMLTLHGEGRLAYPLREKNNVRQVKSGDFIVIVFKHSFPHTHTHKNNALPMRARKEPSFIHKAVIYLSRRKQKPVKVSHLLSLKDN